MGTTIRSARILLLALAGIPIVLSQDDCILTTTITQYRTSESSSASTSSEPLTTIYTTFKETTTITKTEPYVSTANGTQVTLTSTKVQKVVRDPWDGVSYVTDLISKIWPSAKHKARQAGTCPPPVTVTAIFPPSSFATSSSSTMSSSTTSSSTQVLETITSSAPSDINTSSAFPSTTASPGSMVSSDDPVSTSGSSLSPPSRSSSGGSFSLPALSTSSDDGNIPTLSNPESSGTVLFGTIDPKLWESPTPTISCAPPCQLSLPCKLLATPFTITHPPYTTTLCTPHCGLHFTSRTTIQLPPIIATEVCFYPLDGSEPGIITAVPSYMPLPTSIEAPGGYTTCTPYHMFYDDDGKCGPDNNYRCPKKKCCGKDGKCGTGENYCGAGCQLGWSDCWNSSTTCKALNQDKNKDKDDDDNHLIPIFPLWHDRPNPPGPPPTINIEFGEIQFPKPPSLEWPEIIGGNFDCGWLGCDGITGWFLKLIPIKIKPCNPITKMLCKLLGLNCCPKKPPKNGEKDKDCVGCTPPPSDTGLFGDAKVCDMPMEKCDDLEPKEEEEEEVKDCSTTSTVVDKTVHCELVTATNGKSSEKCTSTASETRSGCTLLPAKTKTITSTECETITANHISKHCTVMTAGNSTVTTSCPSTITNTVTGCNVTPKSTSVISTTCQETVVDHISATCSVATGRNFTSTYCPQTRTSRQTGCDLTATTTSVFSTDCHSYTTVTDATESCFSMAQTVVAGITITPSMTCTKTVSTVYTGCDITGSTSTTISTSLVGCQGTMGVSWEPMPTMAANLTSSGTSNCGPPTSTQFGPCTKIVAPGQDIITEPVGIGATATALARRDETATTGSVSCWCGNTMTEAVWPVTMCGNITWCPNEATTGIEVQGDPVPFTISANATSECAIPTSTDLPQCTKIAAGPVVITEAAGLGETGTAVAKRQHAAEIGSVVTGGAVSCVCGSSMTREVWPVTCGSQTWCPNEATSAVEVTGSPVPATLTAS